MTPFAATLPPSRNTGARGATLAYLHSGAQEGLRPRLAVLAMSMDDAVSAAGGRIFDLSMAGWEVTVIAGDLDDPRPARILGAEAVDLDSTLTRRHHRLRPQALAVSAALLTTENRLRGRIRDCLDRGTIEVSFWGHPCAVASGGRTETTTHRLSHAARVFKQQALCVVRGELDTVASTEDFRIGAGPRHTPHRGEPARSGPGTGAQLSWS